MLLLVLLLLLLLLLVVVFRKALERLIHTRFMTLLLLLLEGRVSSLLSERLVLTAMA